MGAGALADRPRDRARRKGLVLNLPHVVASSAWVLAQLGEASEALTRLREGEQLLEHDAAKGIFDNPAGDYHWLGRAALLLGRLDEARRLGDRALYSPVSPRVRGACAPPARRHRDPSPPVRCRERRGALPPGAGARRRGMRPLVAHCHLGLGKLYGRTGKRREAQEHLTTAATLYREMDMRFWLEQTGAEMTETDRGSA